MCGIIGYVGKNNCLPIILSGLKSLEYRGYDSSGIVYQLNDKFKIIKEKGKIVNLEKIMTNDYANIGLGHTRWATHGEPSSVNAHPHLVNEVVVVHNGIIENFQELKDMLITKKYHFVSDTDSEVVAALIDYYYQEDKDIIHLLETIKTMLKGSYALGIMFNGEEAIYAIRHQSPLIVGILEKESFIASDVPAILNYTKDYILLEEDEIAKLTNDGVSIYKNGKTVTKEMLTFNYKIDSAKKNGYKHYMLKEINEESSVVDNLIHLLEENNFKDLPVLTKYQEIDLVACGSAYHAGVIGKYLIEKYLNIPVNVSVASEYRYQKHFKTKNKLFIAISQSGETADTIASLDIAKELGYDTLGIVNVLGSTISRMVDKVLYIYAGCEIAVATTKAYTLQVLMLSMMTFKNIKDKSLKEKVLEEYPKLPKQIDSLIKMRYNKIVNKIYKCEHLFFIGRLLDYALCMEGSLKLKEISYIHSEAYQAGELKHGTISLIEPNTPVIAIVTDDLIASKTISNIKEVKARGAYVILLIKEGIKVDKSVYDELIFIPNSLDLVMPILTVVPLQLIAYYVALKRKCDIDKPRNLAKSVTVE